MSHPSRRSSLQGFTLVELAVVIVIIGLVAGGIMAGSTMMKASRLNSVNTDMNSYIEAAKVFRDKYGYLPGDFPTATSFWGKDNAVCAADTQPVGTPGTCNGTGDGKVWASTESFRFWQQLVLAGMLPGTYTGVAGSGGASHHVPGVNCPLSKIDAAGFSFTWLGTTSGDPDMYDNVYNHVLFFGRDNGSTYATDGVITQGDAVSIDLKYDDGKPAYGAIQSFKPTWFPCTTTAVSATAAYNSSAATKDALNCALIYITGL